MPLALVLAVVLFQLARVDGGGWLALASAACLALPVTAVVLRPRLSDLHVASGPVRTRAGEQVEQRLTVRNSGTRWSPSLRLHDSTPGLSPVVVAVPALPPRAEVTAELRRSAEVRGWAPAGVVELVGTDPLGLLRARRLVSVPGPVAVAPRPVPMDRLVVAGPGTSGSSRPVAGSGTEVLGLRAWRPGDGAVAVSARATARYGRPVVLEREDEGGARLVLLCAAAGAGPGWETAVERSCALAEDLLRRGQVPRLFATGVVAPARPGRADVLDWHARLDRAAPADARTVAQAVQSAGPGGALVLLAPREQDVPAVRAACAGARVRLTVLPGQ